jgi:hypothetical protein
MVARMEGSNVPVKDSDTNKALAMLYKNIEGLESRVSLLITRLSSVLCSKPRCAEQKTDKELTQCALAKVIREASSKIDNIQSIVNDTIEDLEL